MRGITKDQPETRKFYYYLPEMFSIKLVKLYHYVLGLEYSPLLLVFKSPDGRSPSVGVAGMGFVGNPLLTGYCKNE